MTEERNTARHTITVDKRKSIWASGVMDVISFDEENVIADTDSGVLIIKGRNLHISSLDLEKGELNMEGDITSVVYEEGAALNSHKGSLFEKLFR